MPKFQIINYVRLSGKDQLVNYVVSFLLHRQSFSEHTAYMNVSHRAIYILPVI